METCLRGNKPTLHKELNISMAIDHIAFNGLNPLSRIQTQPRDCPITTFDPTFLSDGLLFCQWTWRWYLGSLLSGMQIGRKMCHIKSWQFYKMFLMGKCFHVLPTQKGRLKGVPVKASNLVFLSLSVPFTMQLKESFNMLTSFHFILFIQISRM